jgi:uncharacterized OB-fold protein
VTVEPIALPLPKPIVTSWSTEFWAGLERNEFLLQRCNACQTLQGYPKPLCRNCGSRDLGWIVSSGEAVVYTWTTVVANPPSPFVPELPYTLVIAELAEGVRFLVRYVGDEQIRCGLALRVSFDERHDGVRLPTFVAASG